METDAELQFLWMHGFPSHPESLSWIIKETLNSLCGVSICSLSEFAQWTGGERSLHAWKDIDML